MEEKLSRIISYEVRLEASRCGHVVTDAGLRRSKHLWNYCVGDARY